MRAVLLDGIVEVFLATVSEALCPFQLVFAAEYPAAIVFALNDKDTLLVQPESALPASFRTEEHTNTYTCKIVYGKPHSNKPKQVPDKCLASL